MLFVDVKVKKRMDCASDKVEEDGEMEDDRSTYRVFMHGFMSTTLNVLSTLWTLVWASIFLLYFHFHPTTLVSKFLVTPPSNYLSNLHEFNKHFLNQV
jgi:hypothetical protein